MRAFKLIALVIVGGCAPAGSHYGSWNDGPVAAFTVTQNSPPQGFHYDNGEPVRPTPPANQADFDKQWLVGQKNELYRKYCSQTKTIACIQKVMACANLGFGARSVLAIERRLKQAGISSRMVVASAVLEFPKSTQGIMTPMSHDELAFIAELAVTIPDDESPDAFRDSVIEACIVSDKQLH